MKYILLVGLFLTLSAFGFSPPEFTSNVVDESGILNETDKANLHQSIQKARDTGDIWTAVYIIPSLNGETIEDVASATFKKWELGKEGKDNGLLFVVAINDRKMRIEVGYGLEGSIPDVIAHKVIQENLKPNFKNNYYAAGITEGLERLVKHRLKEEVISPEEGNKFNLARLPGCLALNFAFPIVFWVLFLIRKRSGRKYKISWFGSDLVLGHGGAILFSLFFSLFWMAPEAPLIFIAPFNAIFAIAFGGITMSRSIYLLWSSTAYAEWVGPWLKYDDEQVKWMTGFKKAEVDGTLLEYVEKTPTPEKPNFFFGKLVKFPSHFSSSFKATGSSGRSSSSRSSSSSSSRSSSSSSAGGRSGGGGSSGSW